MTAKVDRYIQNKLEGMTKKDAAIKAGYSPNTAIAPGQKIESTEAYQRACDKYLPDDLIYRKLVEGLDATKVVIAQKDGVITDERVYADYSTRHKYVDSALKIKGDYKVVEQVAQDDDIESLKKEIRELVAENGFHDDPMDSVSSGQ